MKDARELAGEALRKAGKGTDPGAEKIAARRAPKTEIQTVTAVIENFIERYAKPKNRSWRETERIFYRYVVPELGKRPIEEITRRIT